MEKDTPKTETTEKDYRKEVLRLFYETNVHFDTARKELAGPSLRLFAEAKQLQGQLSNLFINLFRR